MMWWVALILHWGLCGFLGWYVATNADKDAKAKLCVDALFGISAAILARWAHI